MFGIKRRQRFERSVAEEIAYMLGLHGDPSVAAEACRQRAGRENIGSSRTRVLTEAADRLHRMARDAATPSG